MLGFLIFQECDQLQFYNMKALEMFWLELYWPVELPVSGERPSLSLPRSQIRESRAPVDAIH